MKTSRMLPWLSPVADVVFILLSIAAALYFLLPFWLEEKYTGFAINLAAGGAIVLVTMLLLKAQSAAEMRKEHDVELLKARLELYGSLSDELKGIIKAGKVTDENRIAVLILSQRIAAIAGNEVVKGFQDFAREFARAAEDNEIDRDEIPRLLKASAQLSAKMREDLVTREELGTLHAASVAQAAESVVNMLPKPLTPEERFVMLCSGEEKAYYSRALEHLRSKKVEPIWGQPGFSVKDADGAPVIWGAPSSSKQASGIRIHKENLTEETQRQLAEFLVPKWLSQGKLEGKKQIRVTPKDMPVEDLCQLLDIVLA